MNDSAMSTDEFWRIIALFDWDQSGDDDAVMERAQEHLSTRPVEDIHRFADLLAGFLYAIDTREHARHGYLGEADPDNGDDYISPDDFLDMRLAVVANGRDFYERVAADPSQMPQDVEFESLRSLAEGSYRC